MGIPFCAHAYALSLRAVEALLHRAPHKLCRAAIDWILPEVIVTANLTWAHTNLKGQLEPKGRENCDTVTEGIICQKKKVYQSNKLRIS